ncbi:MAG: DoxX family membrane protein [Anaerolineales bacterium]|nr:DoxX family membrane protein [Anaerolineales bacterium]
MIAILFFSRSFLGVIFFRAFFPKFRHPRSFAAAVQAYQLIPKSWVYPFALTLPWLELALGLLLLVGWQTRLAALTSAALLLLFLVAMGITLARGRKDPSKANLDYGCSGKKHTQKIGWKTITRNIILILLSLPLVLWGGGFLALDNQSPTVQKFIFETLLLNTLLPLLLTGVGIVCLARLLKQTVRLVMLTPTETQPTEISNNFQNLKTNPTEGSL